MWLWWLVPPYPNPTGIGTPPGTTATAPRPTLTATAPRPR